MYRYIRRGGVLLRDPAEIRDELLALRDALSGIEERKKAADARRREIDRRILAGEASDPALIALLDAIVEECDTLHDEMLALCDRGDALSDELCEALRHLRTTRAS